MYRPLSATPPPLRQVRSLIIVLALFFATIFVVDRFILIGTPAQPLTYTQFYRAVEAGRVADATIQGQAVAGTLKGVARERRSFTTTIADASDVLPALRAHNVEVTIRPSATHPLAGMLLGFIPIALIVVLWLFIVRRARGTGGLR